MKQKHLTLEDREIIEKGLKEDQTFKAIASEVGKDSTTVYRHLHRGYLSVSPMELPRIVKFKPRKAKKADYIPKALKKGRSYVDFQTYKEEHKLTSWTEGNLPMYRPLNRTQRKQHKPGCFSVIQCVPLKSQEWKRTIPSFGILFPKGKASIPSLRTR